ncbi:FAD-dependent monooxygenase [Streptomyces albulus]|nr:FAD-dependent monooxygenase [Streptomyces noursei]
MPLGEADDAVLRYRCLRRGEVNAALQAEAVRRGIGFAHGARLVAVEDGPDRVTARFADGRVATGDLLIGADGLNSLVRRTIAPGVQPVYAGQSVYYGYTRRAPVTEDTGHITMVRGTTAAFGSAVSPDGETYWFARVSGPALPAEELAHPRPPAGANASWRRCARTPPRRGHRRGLHGRHPGHQRHRNPGRHPLALRTDADHR